MTEPIREGLPPVAGTNPGILIVGSFPSERSLEVGEYYANRRNQFWPLLGEVLGFDAALPYPERIAAVLHAGVALWDVVHSCRRAGSLDNKIDRKTLVVNDFDAFFAAHTSATRVFANGLTAFDLYERHVGGGATRLPSSSPAAAAVSFDEKLTHWRAIN